MAHKNGKLIFHLYIFSNYNTICLLIFFVGISGTYDNNQIVKEIMRMKQLSHANILPLTGVSIDNHFSPCIVMPFMWNGSLNTFLQKEDNQEKIFIPVDDSGSEYEVVGQLLGRLCLSVIVVQMK